MNSTPSTSAKDPMHAILMDRRWLDSKSLKVGLLGAVLLHLLGWLALPDNVFHVESGEVQNPYREYSIELANPEEEIPEQFYSQTNPDAPENEPDDTNLFGARSQQAANPDLPDEIDPDNRPSRASEQEFETEQFLTGELDPVEFTPPPPSTPGKESPEQLDAQQPLISIISDSAPLAKKIPETGQLDEEDEVEEEGIADFLRRDIQDSPNDLLEELDGKAEEGEAEDAEGAEFAATVPAIDPSDFSVEGYPSPRPRRKLPRVPPSATRSLNAGVTSVGTLAMDVRASELGEYAERMIETVSTNWDSIVKTGSNPDVESKVVLQFTLTKDGYIKDLERLEPAAKVMSIYECRSAIMAGEPYGEWTDSMIKMHGEEKQIKFVFYYRR